MEEFITKLFAALGFITEETTSSTMFFARAQEGRSEYYLLLFVKKEDLSDGMTTKFEEINALFDTKKKNARDIEKNTSLIICAEFENYREDCLRYKNRLLQIEEDEFFYRKYVVPYTQVALSGLNNSEDLLHSLRDTIAHEGSFEAYNNQMFANEAYFLAMQLFIKLPFLNLSVNSSGDFVTIETLLSQKIAANEKEFLDGVLRTGPVQPEERDQLLKKILDPNDNSFDEFINSFLGNASST